MCWCVRVAACTHQGIAFELQLTNVSGVEIESPLGEVHTLLYTFSLTICKAVAMPWGKPQPVDIRCVRRLFVALLFFTVL